jgi:hypothetical protein
MFISSIVNVYDTTSTPKHFDLVLWWNKKKSIVTWGGGG